MPGLSVSPVTAHANKKAMWGKFLRKTSEQMLGMQAQGKELPHVQEVEKNEEAESSTKNIIAIISEYRSEVQRYYLLVYFKKDHAKNAVFRSERK